MNIDEKRLYKGLGGKISAKRQAIGLNQGQLADGIGLTRTSITNIESGNQRIQLHTLFQIASVLDCSINDLLPDLHQTEGDIASLVNRQKTLDASGEVALKQTEKEIVMKMLRSEASRKE